MTETTTILVKGIKRETPKAILADVEDLDIWLPKSQITKLAFKGSGTLYRIPYWLAGKKGLKGENTADALEGSAFTPEGAAILYEESEPVEAYDAEDSMERAAEARAVIEDEADYLGPSESEKSHEFAKKLTLTELAASL